MIICNPLRVAFQIVPKVGSTSLLLWLYELLYGEPYPPKSGSGGKSKGIHNWFDTQKTNSIYSQPINEFVRPEGYFVFCLTRDPVKRLLSSYKNRVLHFGELGSMHSAGLAAIEAGLVADPELDYFVDNLELYQAVSKNIFFHTRPMVDFLGRELSSYDRIFDLGEMELLRDKLIQHWAINDLQISHQDIPLMPRAQTGGPAIKLHELSPYSFEKLLNYYREDYELFPTCNVAKIRDERSSS